MAREKEQPPQEQPPASAEAGVVATVPAAEPLAVLAGVLERKLTVNPADVGRMVTSKPPPGEEAFDSAKWTRMKALKTFAPVYTDVVSKDKQHYWHPTFRGGEEQLVPPSSLTDKFVELGYLERPAGWYPVGGGLR